MKPENQSISTDLLITLKCFFGFEEVLREELVELGYDDIEIRNRAVRIKGSWKDVYFLNLHCRCSISILVQISHFYIKSEEVLYQRAKNISWTSLFDIKKTFAVKGVVHSTIFRNSQYPLLLIKDAIVDSFRAGRRSPKRRIEDSASCF